MLTMTLSSLLKRHDWHTCQLGKNLSSKFLLFFIWISILFKWELLNYACWLPDFGFYQLIFQLQDMTDVLPCRIHLPVYLWIIDPHSSAPKKNTNHGNEVLLQDTMHLIQRSCYQQGSPCQDPAGNWTTWKPPACRKEMHTAVLWSCLPFIRSGWNHLARHSERGEEDKADRGRGRKTTLGNGQAWTSQSPRGQWRTEKKWRKLVAKLSVVPQVLEGSGEKRKNGGNWLWNHLWCPNDPRG